MPRTEDAGLRNFQIELSLLALFSLLWLTAIAALVGLVPLGGRLPLDLYRFYSVGAVLGWLSGNVYRFRAAAVESRPLRRRLLLIYLLGPPSFLYLIRWMAPAADQASAPLVPLYGAMVYGLFFLVPLTLRASRRPRRPGATADP